MHARSHIYQGKFYGSHDVSLHHFRSKDSNREKSLTFCCACALPTLPRELLRGHVTFDDVASGEKAPLRWILRNFRLRMRTCSLPITWHFMTSHPVAMLFPVMRNGTFCTAPIVRKKAREPHAQNILPVTWLPVEPPRTTSEVNRVTMALLTPMLNHFSLLIPQKLPLLQAHLSQSIMKMPNIVLIGNW